MKTSVRRREFIAGFGAAAALPLTARAQGERMRRIGALMNLAADDRESQARNAAFLQGLQQLGWTDGRNVRIDYRWAAGNAERFRSYAAELLALAPDIILASASPAVAALQQATRTVPIVFVLVIDPVGAGFVASLARPGGNITGVTQHEFSIGAKWLELLKQLAPRVTRVAVLYDPGNPATRGYLAEMEPATRSLGVTMASFGVRDEAEITRAIEGFATEPNGGLVLLPGPIGTSHREAIIGLAARRRLPAVYAFRYHVVSGGLASYGVDNIDLYRRAAWHVDRVLRGEKPADLPVEHATKFQLVINLKTARTLGLDPPLTLLARTDEVIE
jgi:putative ABC transport system substrate-binding protein